MFITEISQGETGIAGLLLLPTRYLDKMNTTLETVEIVENVTPKDWKL